MIDAFKISKIITKLIHKEPELNVNGINDCRISLEDVYQWQIKALKE